jgi:hypothetical protein
LPVTPLFLLLESEQEETAPGPPIPVPFLLVRRLLLIAEAIMLDQPAHKIQAMALGEQFAIFRLLLHMDFHIENPRGLGFSKAQGEQRFKIGVIGCVYILGHDFNPSSQ